MKLIESFAIALRSLLANKLRSVLTMLGIIIGVGAVISLMSLGRGAQDTVASVFEQLGTNVLYVMPRSPEVAGMAGLSQTVAPPSITLGDAEALADVPGVIGIAPVNENFVQVSYGGESWSTVIDGSTPEYAAVYAYTVAQGRFLTARDISARDTVIVLGSEVARQLFGARNPIGQRVTVKGQRFTVIGVFAPKGGAMLGVSLDSVAVTPITTFQTKLFTNRSVTGEDAVQTISVKLTDRDVASSVQDEIEAILHKRHRIGADEKNDFAIVSQDQILGIFGQITSVFTIFLSAIAGISLLVGGIGIMNIMLVSVTERTREIGIRKAVGAKRRDILSQFLIEAATLSLVGGGIGIAGGAMLGFIISRFNFSGITIHAVFTWDIVLLAVSVSLAIGLASGIYPALRASRLNPIDALHYG